MSMQELKLRVKAWWRRLQQERYLKSPYRKGYEEGVRHALEMPITHNGQQVGFLRKGPTDGPGSFTSAIFQTQYLPPDCPFTGWTPGSRTSK